MAGDVIGARLLVTGKVQGVWFRKSTQSRARELSLVGTVRNLPTGQVAVDVQGPPEAVGDLIAFCHEGPEWARVDDVQVERYALKDGRPLYETFHILHG